MAKSDPMTLTNPKPTLTRNWPAKAGQRSKAELLRKSAHRERPWADRKYRAVAGQWHSGTRCGVADDRTDPCREAGDSRSRHGPRYQRFCSRVPPTERNAARLTK